MSSSARLSRVYRSVALDRAQRNADGRSDAYQQSFTQTAMHRLQRLRQLHLKLVVCRFGGRAVGHIF